MGKGGDRTRNSIWFRVMGVCGGGGGGGGEILRGGERARGKER